jgi:hypothetical protein
MSEDISERISYENHDGVGVWTVDDLAAALESGELEDGESHFREVAGDPGMTGAVVVLENSGDIGDETLGHVSEQWTKLGDATGIERTAYVSEGLARLAVSGQNQAEGMETRGFESVEAALEWTAEV